MECFLKLSFCGKNNCKVKVQFGYPFLVIFEETTIFITLKLINENEETNVNFYHEYNFFYG